MGEHEQGADNNALVASPTSSRSANNWAQAIRPPPVFLHSSFRTGSTWFWQKFRSAPTTLAYYEIFNGILQTITPANAKTMSFAIWDSRHPPATPYFLEFLPLLQPAGGVAEFDDRTSFGRFIPDGGPDGDLSSFDHRYVDRLLASAWSQNRIPILSCTRSIGRARALRRAFGGRSVLLHRNLFHQWTSYCWQAEVGNETFLRSIRQTICGARHDPFLRIVADWFELDRPSIPQHELFEAFVVLHLYLYGMAFDAADLIVDMTDIATDRDLRRQVEQDLSEMIHHDIDLSDVKESCEFTSLQTDCPEKTRDTIEQFAKLIPAGTISANGLQFIAQMKDRALAEWDRYEFFTRRTRSVLTRQISQSHALADQRMVESDGLKAERDRLTHELSEASRVLDAERSAQAEALRTLVSEKNDAAQRLAQAETDRDRLTRDVEAARATADAALKSVAELAGQRDALEKDLICARAAREDLMRAEGQRDHNASILHRAGKLLARRR